MCNVFITKYEWVQYFTNSAHRCLCVLQSKNRLNKFLMQQNQKAYMGRTFDLKQISAMFRLIWLSGVLLSWKIHTDRYHTEVELISFNCGLCCFTSPVQVSLSPILTLLGIDKYQTQTKTDTHTPAHTCTLVAALQCTNKWAGIY